MKLYVLSDLHVEFAPFVPDLAAAEAADVVVLAGDIHTAALGMAWAREAVVVKVDVAKRGLIRLLFGWFEVPCFEGYRD